MTRPRLAFVILAAAFVPISVAAQGVCPGGPFSPRYGGPDGGPDLQDFLERIRRACEPGQRLDVYVSRGMPVSPAMVAGRVCQGGAFDEMSETRSPWFGSCRYRHDGSAP